MQDAGILIEHNSAPCLCRCKHCLLSWQEDTDQVLYVRSRAVARKFAQWAKEPSSSDMTIDFRVGRSAEFKDLIDYIQFRHENGMEEAGFLPVNGIAFRDEEALVEWLTKIKQAGIVTIGVSFYGVGASHDKWAGRQGDFDYVMLLTRKASEMGLQRQETIFLRRKILDEYTPLLDQLDAIPGMSGRTMAPCDFRGLGKLLERERIEKDDLKRLPVCAMEFVNQTNLKTEKEWIDLVVAQTVPEKQTRYFRVVTSDGNLRKWESMPCGQILEHLQNIEAQHMQTLPPLPYLAAAFGEKDNQALYTLCDMEWKWEEEFFSQNPDKDQTGRFDDLKSGVWYK